MNSDDIAVEVAAILACDWDEDGDRADWTAVHMGDGRVLIETDTGERFEITVRHAERNPA